MHECEVKELINSHAKQNFSMHRFHLNSACKDYILDIFTSALLV